MSDIDFDAQEARCRNLIDLWRDNLGLRHWFVSVECHRTEHPDNPLRVAQSLPAWEYLQVHIDVYMPLIVNMPDSQLEYWLIHEMCHALVDEMHEPDDNGKHEERVVCQLAMALRWVRNAAADGRLPRTSDPTP